MYRVLYLGDNNPHSTSYHRAAALMRLGCEVKIYNPFDAISSVMKNRVIDTLHYRTGYKYVQSTIHHWLQSKLYNSDKLDLVWVNSGELLGPKCLKLLKHLNCPIVLYNNDDPPGRRDGNRFNSLIKALPFYNLVVVVRDSTMNDFKKMGLSNIMRVFMSYDEIAHQPFSSFDDIPYEFKSEVAFIGTWMRNENRDRFLIKLIEKNIPLSIWGNRWDKSPFWNALKPFVKGQALGGRDYIAAIQGAKICLGLLSKGNRDLHTQRSLEIPYAYGLLCAERTIEHQNLFVDGKEAVFWSDVDECVHVCNELLSNPMERERIRVAGMEKIGKLNLGNEDVCRSVLNRIQLTTSSFHS